QTLIVQTLLKPVLFIHSLDLVQNKWQVLSEYRSRGLDFVMQAINEPTYLEDLTGLTDLMKCTDISQVEWVDEVKDDEFADI
uniref:Uncharacterized protein n=1 Tax=Aegilops tauschii subsp. strangulata TaxID=200361 RepID=A0A453BZ66_AEGTS